MFNKLDHKEFLRQLGGYMLNRENGKEGLTMAGLLMFVKGLPIRERFDNLRLDYIDKSHLIGDQRYSDRLTYDGTWENNLYNFATFVLPRLTKELPRPFKMNGTERDDDTPQHKAVREALTNAIIHADLVIDGVLKVEKYDDRFVFTNPGLLKIPVKQIYNGYETRARNQRIQNMFRMIGFGENLGSGFPLILSAWNEKHWLEPELVEQTDLRQVKLTLHILTGHGGNDGGNKLTERQRLVLGLIKEDSHISANEIVKRLSVTGDAAKRTIERELAALKKSRNSFETRKPQIWEMDNQRLSYFLNFYKLTPA